MRFCQHVRGIVMKEEKETSINHNSLLQRFYSSFRFNVSRGGGKNINFDRFYKADLGFLFFRAAKFFLVGKFSRASTRMKSRLVSVCFPPINIVTQKHKQEEQSRQRRWQMKTQKRTMMTSSTFPPQRLVSSLIVFDALFLCIIHQQFFLPKIKKT